MAMDTLTRQQKPWSIPNACLRALELLEQNGYQAWIVGGAVRDLVRGTDVKDWDIACNADAETLLRLFASFRCLEMGRAHGTITVLIDDLPLEITTFRGASPTLEADLALRDFTINAMSYHPQKGLMDPFGARADLKEGVIRAVGSARERLSEDPLRILRALRFASQMAMRIDSETYRAMEELAPALLRIACERVREELHGLLLGASVASILRRATGIVSVVLPEIRPMLGFDQRNRYHCHDVWNHTVEVIAHCPQDLLLRWAALFHDMGKPETFTLDANGCGHFYGHAKESLRHAAEIMSRLKFDKKSREIILFLVEQHDLCIALTPKAVRRALQRFDYAPLKRLLPLFRADTAGHSALCAYRMEEIDRLEQMLDEIYQQNGRFTRKDLAVNGHDLMALGYHGADLSRILEKLVTAVVFEGCENSRQALLERAKAMGA